VAGPRAAASIQRSTSRFSPADTEAEAAAMAWTARQVRRFGLSRRFEFDGREEMMGSQVLRAPRHDVGLSV
jgi:hypothetical protein